MHLNTILFNLLLTTLAAARYVPSDPATCSKDPNKRDLTAQGETDEIAERSPMGGSLIEGRDTSRIICVKCCRAATEFCMDACSARYNGGGGLTFWAMAGCQATCQSWSVACVSKC
ncbi:hypothetical protein E4U60_007600 [Claviceps pazoutovae]|uniref:Uncharacterized protein n=1 Tax=Claviceps pazoutovae TaxID=1649127 RepID=A0A9P7M3E4_9HYPO|nr:hypothetical protein E4U60_007600 [Claviceps pazoutovae]